MQIFSKEISPLGMGCWPIGGPMFKDGRPLGYANSDDAESIRTIHAALEGGITLFDTAAAYGAGHAEKLLGQALRNRPEAVIVSKLGLAIDETTKEILGEEASADSVLPAIENSLKRLQRDCLDIVLLHLNSLPIDRAMPIFEEMEKARIEGKIRGYGWSTDFTGNVEALSKRDGVVAVEHGTNVFCDTPKIRRAIAQQGLVAFIRSPLAMGLLGGNYRKGSVMPKDDIRSTEQMWLTYYKDGKPNIEFLEKLDAVRDLLQSDGRSLPQGALGWLWAKSDRNFPLPGARTVAQIQDLAGALKFGALPKAVVSEIDILIGPKHEDYVEKEL
ncbi:aldo/keto reductase [uncultured Roseibium sp.]|uniref:aldo/keto reductase n=1 Tax=uncultured Roseibium sp. TaxID=1936171 RepID=UPI00261848C6|nr:aldo/keto reductase [uncultured Roseibium sp.]